MTNYVPGGGRNGYLATLAHNMRHLGLDQSAIEEALLAENAVKCRPQLTENEVRTLAAGIGTFDSSWPHPEPIPMALRPVPDLDLKLLPEAIRDWVADIAYRQGCPPEFAAVTVLTHLGTIVGRKIGVRPKRHGDPWTVVPNMWGACIGPPSMMKSPAIREARLPFKMVEKRLLEDAEEEQAVLREEFTSMKLEFDAEEAAVKQVWKDLKTGKTIKRGKLPDRIELNERSADLSNTKTKLDEMERLAFVERRIEVNDPTPEALQVVLQNNPNGILYFNDELTTWLEALGKPGREGSRQMHLEMADGTDTGTVDRIGRGHNEYNKIESIFGSIQPGPLGAMVDKALSNNKSNDGLIQRFQLLVWRNTFRGRPKDVRPDYAAAARASNAFMRCYEITAKEAECQDADIPYLHLSPEAYDLWWDWYEDLQDTACKYPEALASHMMKYPSLVTSLALVDHLTDGGTGDIRLVSIRRAFGLLDWLWEHAQRIYTSGKHLGNAALIQLCHHILYGDLGYKFSLRELKRKGWSGIDNDSAPGLLYELQEMGWLRETKEVGEKGGRPSFVYTINPQCKKKFSPKNVPIETVNTDITDTGEIDHIGFDSYDSELVGKTGGSGKGDKIMLDENTRHRVAVKEWMDTRCIRGSGGGELNELWDNFCSYLRDNKMHWWDYDVIKAGFFSILTGMGYKVRYDLSNRVIIEGITLH